MIQLNLLPDIKLEYIRTQRTRRLLVGVSVIMSAIAIGLLLLLLSVSAYQKKHLRDLSDHITSQSKTLSSQPQIGRILTVQNQLTSLTSLHDAKPAGTRLFGYITRLTPAQVSISSLNMDLTTQSVVIEGGADSLSTVNKYVDTLKFTTYTVRGQADKNAAFGNVVLKDFSLKTDEKKDDEPAATYSITLTYDPAIFDITKSVTLSIPTITTTRSELTKPPALFKAAPVAPAAGTVPGTAPAATTPAATPTPTAGGTQ